MPPSFPGGDAPGQSGPPGGGPPGLLGSPDGGPPGPPGPPGGGSSGPPGDSGPQGPVIHVAKWFCPRPKHCGHEQICHAAVEFQTGSQCTTAATNTAESGCANSSYRCSQIPG